MLRRIIGLVMCLAILSATTFVFAEDVYITKRGKKYHKQDCPLIAKRDAQKVSLEEARAKGLEPCSRCFESAKKPTAQEVKSAKAESQELVYITANGKKYHKENCRLIKNKNVTGISLAEAQEKGLQPCSRCFLQEAKAE